MDNLREQIETMSIFGLRDMARKLGHPKSTTQKHSALVEFCLEKYSEEALLRAETEEKDKKKGRGRPPKANDTWFGVKAVVPEILKVANTNEAGDPIWGDLAKPPEVVDQSVQEKREGILEICPDGFGFLRAKNYQQGERDAYIPIQKIKGAGLRRGDHVVATVKKIAENRPMCVQDVESVNGFPVGEMPKRKNFENLVPIYPDSRMKLELPGVKNDFAIRSIDLVAPIGKGQRGMIVSPP